MKAFIGSTLIVGLLAVGCSLEPNEGASEADVDDGAATATSQQPLVVAPGGDLRFNSFTQTTQTTVDGFQQFSLTVQNYGTADVNPTTLTIQLLATQTSPQTYLLGQLQAVPTGCSLSGRNLVCSLGQLRSTGPIAMRRKTINFGYRIPVTTQALTLTASVSGTGEPNANATDNTASVAAAVTYRAPAVTPGLKTTSHCTGTTLSAYFECTKFPSSIMSHEAEYHGDGTIVFPGTTDYSGTWSQPDPTRLHVEYTNGVYSEVVFDGRGADGSCFEGISTFFGDYDGNPQTPPTQSTYRAAYRICF